MRVTRMKLAVAVVVGSLLHAGGGVARGAAPPATAPATGRANDIDLSVVPPERFTGEPYTLAGKRVVFTSWYYVRPGGYAWKDDAGENVTASRARAVGPREAHYERKW